MDKRLEALRYYLLSRFFTPSVDRFLLKKFGRLFFRTFKDLNSDRRTWLVTAAKVLAIPTHCIFEEYASYSGFLFLPFNSQQPISESPNAESSLFSLFGVTPVYDDHERALIGLTASDPLWARFHLPREYRDLRWYLSINNAQEEKLKNSSKVSIGVEVFEEIIKAGISLTAQSIEITVGSNVEPTYLIRKQDGRKAAGTINNSYVKALKTHLIERTKINKNFTDIFQNTAFILSRSSPSTFEIDFEKNTTSVEGVPTEKVEVGGTPYVLLIDDNKSFVQIVSKYLNSLSISVETAGDGEEGLHRLRSLRQAPAVIVCDVHMPKKNGFELIQNLKDEECFSNIPIISFSSDTDVEAEIALLQLGVVAFIKKGDDPRLLATHVRRILAKQVSTSITYQ